MNFQTLTELQAFLTHQCPLPPPQSFPEGYNYLITYKYLRNKSEF